MPTPTTVDEDTGERSSRPAGRVSRSRRYLAFVAFAFFFAPVIAYVFGDRARPIENRELADAPSPAHGWQFFPETSSWLTDHLPLRRQAIDSNASFSRRVFDEEPAYGSTGGANAEAPTAGLGGDGDGPAGTTAYPQVVSGRDGWLYSGEDFKQPCKANTSVQESLARIDRIARLVEASGRRMVFTVAPNKSTITPRFLPDTILGRDCWESARDRLWQSLQDKPPAYYFDLRGPLEKQQRADGSPIYLELDTHWAPRARGVYAKQLADALDPHIWPGTKILAGGVRPRGGDLARLLAEDREAPVKDWTVVRPGTTSDTKQLPLANGTPQRVHHSSTGVEVFAPRTLLIGDSFSRHSAGAVLPLFGDVTVLNIEDASDAVVASSIAEAEVVVVEIVERHVSGGGSKLLRKSQFNAIKRALR